MNGVHDMGGMHGFGSIPIEENEPVFHYAWEGRVYVLRGRTGVRPPGGGRYALERMNPGLYLSSSYYERWLHAGVQGYIEAGVFSQAEFDEYLNYFQKNPQAVPPRREDPEAVQLALANSYNSKTRRVDSDMKPAFEIGATVKTRNMHPAGHTRLPGYARDKRGQIVNYYGVQLFDDAVSAGRSNEAQPLYNVRFEGQELWGESAEPNSAVYLDMWESYLEAV